MPWRDFYRKYSAKGTTLMRWEKALVEWIELASGLEVFVRPYKNIGR